MNVNINKIATGDNIKRLMRKNKKSTFDIMMALHLTSATNVYAWTQGRIIPNAENLARLATIFNCLIDDILVIEYSKEADDED